MPIFEYLAINSEGDEVQGLLDAPSIAQAQINLKTQGLYPVTIQEGKARKSSAAVNSITFGRRIRQEDIHLMTRQLATLISASVPLVPALSSLVEQTTNPSLKKLIAQVRESVNEGATLADSLSNHPKQFSTLYINMIRAGEMSGTLPIVLDRLADFGESQQVLHGQIRAATVYPLFMVVIGMAILIFLITYIVPDITEVFHETGRSLPIATRILIAGSEVLQRFWWVIPIGIICINLGYRRVAGIPVVRLKIDYLILKAPVIGPLLQKILLARFSSTLGSMLSSDLELVQALRISTAMLENVRFTQVLEKAIVEIVNGRELSEALVHSQWFPPMFIQMIKVGEQSGTLETMLSKVADSYTTEIRSRITGITSLIEPIMIVVMGGLVGFVVLSILLPIFEMNQLAG